MTPFRIGFGYDVHRLAEDIPLVLGGVSIPHNKGCVAHSDGDVLLHALCDALLGAAAMGDIGKHFPDTDDAYRNINSLFLLSEVAVMLKQQSYAIANVDITLAMQKPKIAPYIATMQQTIADCLEIEHNRVSIKATTTEKLGFVGEEIGVEAYAVALIYNV